MPKKTTDPADQPPEQAASPTIIGETDVERRLDEELAAMEARASPQTETEPPGEPPEGAEESLLTSRTEADNTNAAATTPAKPVRRRKAATPVEGGEIPSQSGGEPKDEHAEDPEEPPAPPAEAPSGDKPATGSFLRPLRKRKEAPTQDDGEKKSESEDAPVDEPPTEPAAAPMPARPLIPRGPRVVSIDEQRTVETQADKLRNDVLDLTESMKGGRILTGTIQGVERSVENRDVVLAVLYHGDFKIIIPAEQAIQPPENFRDREPSDVMHYLLMKRLGAEIDYIVKGLDIDNRIAAASRLDAMARRRREYYYGERDRNPTIRPGVNAEARIVCAIRSGIFVDIFGMEVYIALKELSYQRWLDAAQHYQPGQRVLLKILEVERNRREVIKVEASVKLVGENPYEKALRRYSIGNRYVGTVSVVDPTGVFVSLDGGIDCLCTFPKRGRPPRGSRVTVRIHGIDLESNRIWGSIVHMTN